ncbi:hypothetical protein [Streptomyces decoyicus]|uniref:hypothetical protein n=1 Tax=Streptomyces decoyicus TaxID=249567 RepID=UPI003666BB6F
MLAKKLGLKSHAPVADWEALKSFPPAEKIPAIAAALEVSLNDFAPRDGEPDLKDLRCDAGYTQSQAAKLLAGVVSRFQLGKAERGERRLGEKGVAAAALLYRVDKADLQEAEDRTFEEFASSNEPAPEASPQTLAEKINALIQRAFPGDQPPSDEKIATVISTAVGSAVIQGPQLRALRAGAPADSVFSPLAKTIAFEGMAAYFDVSPMHFQDEASRRHQVFADLRYLASEQGIDIAARAGEGGVSEAMLTIFKDLVEREIRESGESSS